MSHEDREIQRPEPQPRQIVMTQGLLLQAIALAFSASAGAVGAYAAIRSDLAEIRQIATAAGTVAKEAHQRIDTIILHRSKPTISYFPFLTTETCK